MAVADEERLAQIEGLETEERADQRHSLGVRDLDETPATEETARRDASETMPAVVSSNSPLHKPKGILKNAGQPKKDAEAEEPEIELRALCGRIVVYSILGCPHCLEAKRLLSDFGLPYIDVLLDSYNLTVRQDMAQHANGKTSVPQIFFNDFHVGGLNDLRRQMKNKAEFETLIEKLETTEASSGAPSMPDRSLLLPTAPTIPSELSVEYAVADEHVVVVKQLRESGLIKDHSVIFGGGRHTFKGKEFVDWLADSKQIAVEHATDIAQAMLEALCFKTTSGDNEIWDPAKYYRILTEHYADALNITAEFVDNEPLPLEDVCELLQETLQRVYDKHVEDNLVDYEALPADADWQEYLRLTHQLQRIDMLQATREQVLALFCTIYNSMVMQQIVEHGPPTYYWTRRRFVHSFHYVIGGETYNPYQIINGVLRANSKGNGMFTRAFGKSDMRLEVALNEAEPLALFALNTAAKGFPAIRTYSPATIDDELTAACKDYIDCDRGVKLNRETRYFELSEFFKWYKDDFGERLEHTLLWVEKTAHEGEKKKLMDELMNGQMYVQHFAFDWGLNALQRERPPLQQ